MRILVIDDEPSLRRLLTMYLTRHGYDVATADNGAGGYEVLSRSPLEIGLVILDGTVSGTSVDDLAIRLLTINPALRVIVASGYPVDMAGLLAAAPGRAMFLQKPFTTAALLAAVRRMLGKEESLSPGQGSEGHRTGAGGAGPRGADH